MPKKITLTTTQTTASVAVFLNSLTDPVQKKDAKTISTLMKQVTGKSPKMWGESIVGFDSYEYNRSNGDFGEFLALGFSPRKSALSIYIMPGYQDYGDILNKLGPHKTGKSCLYIKRLADIDSKILEKLLKRGYNDLQKMYPEK